MSRYIYDIQKNAHELATLLHSRYIIMRQQHYFIQVELTIDVRIDLDYMGNGVWGIDPCFTSSQIANCSNKKEYSEFLLMLSEFNIASSKRYKKTL